MSERERERELRAARQEVDKIEKYKRAVQEENGVFRPSSSTALVPCQKHPFGNCKRCARGQQPTTTTATVGASRSGELHRYS